MHHLKRQTRLHPLSLLRPLAQAFTTFGIACLMCGCAPRPLPSWNEGPTKDAIVRHVERTTDPASADYVPPSERIAVFDNDGTLWSEQPMYFQIQFAVDRLNALAHEHPEWKDTEPYASVLRGDVMSALAGNEKELLEIMKATHAGMTTEEYAYVLKDWFATARHPTTLRPYTEMVYQPMLELLAYLRANGYKTFIVSCGGIEFMRVFAEQTYDIPPEQVVGSSGKTKYEMRDGVPVLVKLPEINFITDDEGKPIAINQNIGRRPIAAFGNSDSDLQMLQWTAAGPGLRLCVFVHHTDAEHEWAYDRQSLIGALDKGLDEAKAKGWTVIDMKNDWNRIHPFVQTGAVRHGSDRRRRNRNRSRARRTLRGQITDRSDRIVRPPQPVRARGAPMASSPDTSPAQLGIQCVKDRE